MKFIILDAREKLTRVVDFPELSDAMVEAGLKPGNVDFGAIRQGVAYVVYEFGFMIPKDEQRFSRVGRTLIAGNAVFYGYNEQGETVDLDRLEGVGVLFYANAAQVEKAIARGAVIRPENSINGEVIWRWPDPPPPSMAAEMKRKGIPT